MRKTFLVRTQNTSKNIRIVRIFPICSSNQVSYPSKRCPYNFRDFFSELPLELATCITVCVLVFMHAPVYVSMYYVVYTCLLPCKTEIETYNRHTQIGARIPHFPHCVLVHWVSTRQSWLRWCRTAVLAIIIITAWLYHHDSHDYIGCVSLPMYYSHTSHGRLGLGAWRITPTVKWAYWGRRTQT